MRPQGWGGGPPALTSHQNPAAVIRLASCRLSVCLRGALLGGTGAGSRSAGRQVLESRCRPSAQLCTLHRRPGLLLPGSLWGAAGIPQEEGAPASLAPPIAHAWGRPGRMEHPQAPPSTLPLCNLYLPSEDPQNGGSASGKRLREAQRDDPGEHHGGGQTSPPPVSPPRNSSASSKVLNLGALRGGVLRSPLHWEGSRAQGRRSCSRRVKNFLRQDPGSPIDFPPGSRGKTSRGCPGCLL